jgi:uncharacterized protein (TIGR03437 family)
VRAPWVVFNGGGYELLAQKIAKVSDFQPKSEKLFQTRNDSALTHDGPIERINIPACILENLTQDEDRRSRFRMAQFVMSHNQVMAASGLLALAALAVSAHGATYYVGGSGSDSNSGLSASAPFRTIQAAANLTAPGDVVYVMNGVYTTCAGCNVLDITRSGTADAWIAYRAYPGHRPFLNAGAAWNAIQVHGGASYIEISGFQVKGNLPNVTLAQCTAQALEATPDPACNGNGIDVDGRQDGAHKPHHILIAGNEVYDCPGGGIGTEEADYLTIQDNFVHDNALYSRYGNSGISVFESWNYDLGPAPHTIVRRNRLFDNRSLVPYGDTGKPTDGDGIIIDTSRNNQPGSDDIGAYQGGFLVENNLSVNNGGGGLLAYQSDNITFLNNTVYGNGLVVEYSDVFINQSGTVNVWNNLIESAATGTAVNVYGSTAVQFDYNIYWTGPVNATPGPHDLTADPQFNALGTEPATSDFHPVEDSPAVHSGNLAVAPPDDLESLTRPQRPGAVNRGAYESAISGSVAFPAAGVVNAASYQGGGVAPGELLTIFGTGFGAKPIALAGYGSDLFLPVEAGDTRVYFDNIAAPMIYSYSGQVSAVAPYEISGTTQVQVEYAGLRSQPVAIPVSAAAPGVYCYAGGTGQAVAVNTLTDGTVNLNIDHPVASGSYLTFFITGEGVTAAPWADGMLPVAPLFPMPTAQVSVRIGGVPSNCSGNWVGMIFAGITQVNACVPAGVPTGDAVPLVVSVGGVSAQAGVTVRIGS